MQTLPGVVVLQRLGGGEQLDALLQLDGHLLLGLIHAAVLGVLLHINTQYIVYLNKYTHIYIHTISI